MVNKYPQILDRLSPYFAGAIWLGTEHISNETSGFQELNYIFDGLISQTIELYSDEPNDKHLAFYTKSFGENFFLYYFINNIKTPFTIPSTATSKRNKVLIINANSKNKIEIKKIENEFPSFQFEVLELL
jgi:hypothetical protein